jgi:hypothetical protein
MLAWHVLHNGVGVPRQHDLTFRSKRNKSCTNMQGRQSDALILKCMHELLHESGGKQRNRIQRFGCPFMHTLYLTTLLK